MTVAEIFDAAGLTANGPVPWRSKVGESSPGIYVVALTNDSSAELPCAVDAEYLNPQDAKRWLRNEAVVYIGRAANQGLSKRLSQFYHHKHGQKSPHRGGESVILLQCDLWVYWAPTTDSIRAEQRMLAAFKDRAGKLPFANRLGGTAEKNPDTKLVEFAGRNWLASQLFRSGLEVARPERDRGIDLIAYLDMDECGSFIACPIQMKAATNATFSLSHKYRKFPDLILAYVWNVEDPAKTTCFALTYDEAHAVAKTMGYTESPSFAIGGAYTTTKPSATLRELLAPFEMNSTKWRAKLAQSVKLRAPFDARL